MKSKRKKLISALLVLLIVCLFSLPAVATQSSKETLSDWGKKLSSYASKTTTHVSSNEDIYAIGENATITKDEIDQATDFYIISGLNESNAREKAIQYCMEREAMDEAAIDAGYAVSDDEIYAYLQELKNTIHSSTNKENVQEIINQFDSEEDYWNYQFVVYEKNLPIQNYVSALEKSFGKDSKSSDNWNTYFETLKASIVADENYELL